jgi:hypothetical protein
MIKRNTSLTILSAFILLTAAVTAQVYEGRPCGNGDPTLAQKLHAGKVGAISEPGGKNGLFDAWSTSMLRAEGTPPKSPGPCAKIEPGSPCENHLMSYHEWTCMYCAASAMDNNPHTAWVEGAAGDGIGEAVMVKADITRPVRIWAGLGRSEKLYRANNRPRRVAVYALEGIGGAAQSEFAFSDIRVLGRREVELRDVNGYQFLPLPAGTIPPRENQHTFVAVEILSVYPGAKFKDTCISEINNRD